MISRCLSVSIVLLTLVLPRAVAAAEPQMVGVPVYDPQSKRYFALMRADKAAWANRWDKVAQQAQRLTYKGVHGRLAIVDSPQVHQFLLEKFHYKLRKYAWIGLQYHCRSKQLRWSDGRLYQRGSFQAWDQNWKQDVYFCGNTNDPNDWAPIAYSVEGTWIGKGRGKGYDWYYIEYPTGKP